MDRPFINDINSNINHSRAIKALSENSLIIMMIKPINIQQQHAFSLIELMVAVAIVGVSATIAVPAYSDYMERVRTEQAIMDINQIAMRIESYNPVGSANLYPVSLADIGMDNMRDPWGNPYQYLNLTDGNIPGAKGKARKDHSLVPINSDYDLYSMGKDGGSQPPLTSKASRDDIVRANNGRFVGLASKY